MNDNSPTSIDWNNVVKKDARGADDSDFGEVQEVGQNYVLVQKGTIEKERFYIPKYLVQGYDGDTLWFDTTATDIAEFKRDSAPEYDEYTKFRKQNGASDIETRIPLIEERMDISKKVNTGEVTIVKEPVTETRTVEVPVTHEEIRIERRAATSDASANTTVKAGDTERPVESRSEVKIPVTSEEIVVTKRPYVKEEVVVTKEPVTETKTVTDTVRSERLETDHIGSSTDTTSDASIKGAAEMAEDTARDIKEGAADAAEKAKSVFDKVKQKAKDALE